jgi:hypothetical protein
VSDPPEPQERGEELDQESRDVYDLFLRRFHADQAGTESILFNRPDPDEPWNVERAQEARRDRQSEQRHQLTLMREQHALQEEAKDRKIVRGAIIGLGVLVAAAFIYLGSVNAFAENNARQKWAQESLVVLFTATVSAVAGWFANRKS